MPCMARSCLWNWTSVSSGSASIFLMRASVWGMPERERGLFAAWRELSRHDMFRSPDGEWARQVLEANSDPKSLSGDGCAGNPG